MFVQKLGRAFSKMTVCRFMLRSCLGDSDLRRPRMIEFESQ